MQNELETFQAFVNNILIRNKSILDQTTKLQDACTHLCRNVSKSATTCGCISINAHKHPYPICEDLSMDDLKNLMQTHINGKLCSNCEELLEKEIGRIFFYLSAIANTFDLSLSEILENEKKRTELLGKFSLR